MVLLSLADASFAAAILGWNGGAKFTSATRLKPLAFRWGRPQLTALLRSSLPSGRSSAPLDKQQKLLELALVAGTPGFLLRAVCDLFVDGQPNNNVTRMIESGLESTAHRIHDTWVHGNDFASQYTRYPLRR